MLAITDGNEDIVVVELLGPSYDATSDTVTYGVNILADYAGTGWRTSRVVRVIDIRAERQDRSSPLTSRLPPTESSNSVV